MQKKTGQMFAYLFESFWKAHYDEEEANNNLCKLKENAS